MKAIHPITRRICTFFLSALAAIAVVGVVFMETLNGPVSIASTELAVVVSGEFYPTDKFSAQAPPKIRILLDSGQPLLIKQNLPFKLKNGDRLRIKVWKRRFFGYKTSYEPA